VLVKVLDAATPSLNDLAREAGISVRAIRAYRYGKRTPEPKVLKALVAALRKHSGRLATLADELEAASEPKRRRK
jgi:transcriptional regulator with XRE-family HTH domain